MSETDISTAAVERLLDGVTEGPWEYRPHELDDWGVVRAGAFVLCQARDPAMMDDSQLAQCRADGSDPWSDNARFVAASRDLVPALLADRDRLAAEVARLTAEVEQMYQTLHAARDCISSASDQLTKRYAKELNGKKWGWWYLDLANAAIAANAARREGEA